MQELIEFIARSLVDHPEKVVVEEQEGPRGTSYVLTVDPSDMGRVIGRQGRIARSIRSLVAVAATRQNVRANLEIRES